MNAQEFREATTKLGLKTKKHLAYVLRSDKSAVFRWENGFREVPGPVTMLIELYLKYPRIVPKPPKQPKQGRGSARKRD